MDKEIGNRLFQIVKYRNIINIKTNNTRDIKKTTARIPLVRLLSSLDLVKKPKITGGSIDRLHIVGSTRYLTGINAVKVIIRDNTKAEITAPL